MATLTLNIISKLFVPNPANMKSKNVPLELNKNRNPKTLFFEISPFELQRECFSTLPFNEFAHLFFQMKDKYTNDQQLVIINLGNRKFQGRFIKEYNKHYITNQIE